MTTSNALTPHARPPRGIIAKRAADASVDGRISAH